MTKEQIVAEAMTLPFDERQKVAEQLMLSLSEAERDRIDAAWLAAAKRRHDAAARGEVKTSPVDEVIDRVLSRARQ